MELEQLKKAVDKLLSDGIEGDEPLLLKAGGNSYYVSGVTVVVESDDWVPGTVVLTVEEYKDST